VRFEFLIHGFERESRGDRLAIYIASSPLIRFIRSVLCLCLKVSQPRILDTCATHANLRISLVAGVTSFLRQSTNLAIEGREITRCFVFSSSYFSESPDISSFYLLSKVAVKTNVSSRSAPTRIFRVYETRACARFSRVAEEGRQRFSRDAYNGTLSLPFGWGGKKIYRHPNSLIMHDGSRVTCTFSASRLAIGLHKRAILITDAFALTFALHRMASVAPRMAASQ